MAMTIKGLKTALKKAHIAQEKVANKYTDALKSYYVVTGNPASGIVYGSYTLHELFCRYDVAQIPYLLEQRRYKIYRKVPSYFGGKWYKADTKRIIARLKALNAKYDYWEDKIWDIEHALEEKLDDIYYTKDKTPEYFAIKEIIMDI